VLYNERVSLVSLHEKLEGEGVEVLDLWMGVYFDTDEGAGGGVSEPDDAPKTEVTEDHSDTSDDMPGPVPYDRFKEVVGENKGLKDRLNALEKSERERKEKQAEAEGKYKDLYEQERARNDQLEHHSLINQVALEKGLPANLADRLKGGNREELEADADKLLEFVPEDRRREVPGVPRPNSNRSSKKVFDLENMTPEEIRVSRADILSSGQ